jgi:hypothetical protein
MSAASQVLQDFSNATADLVATTARSVVAVHGREWGQSSGIVVKPGIVVTAEEALDKEEEIEITLPDGSNAKAALAGRDPSTDVAVLRFEGEDATSRQSRLTEGGQPRLSPSAATARTASLHRRDRLAPGDAGEARRTAHRPDAAPTFPRAPRGRPAGRCRRQARGHGGVRAPPGARHPHATIPGLPVLPMARSAAAMSASSSRFGSTAKAKVAERWLSPRRGAAKTGVLLGDIVLTWDGEVVSGTRSVVDRPDRVRSQHHHSASPRRQPDGIDLDGGRASVSLRP